MSKYIVVEMQNGIIGTNAWTYDSRDDAEVKMYQVLAEVVKSPVDTHTVLLVTDEGFVIDCKCYKHGTEPEPEPEPATEQTEPTSETVSEGA